MPQAESYSLSVWPSFIEESTQEHTGTQFLSYLIGLTSPALQGSEQGSQTKRLSITVYGKQYPGGTSNCEIKLSYEVLR